MHEPPIPAVLEAARMVLTRFFRAPGRPLRFDGWGGCEGGLTEPEDLVGALAMLPRLPTAQQLPLMNGALSCSPKSQLRSRESQSNW